MGSGHADRLIIWVYANNKFSCVFNRVPKKRVDA